MQIVERVGRVFVSVSEFYRDINPATLTGAIDVIVIEGLDSHLACSPFHVTLIVNGLAVDHIKMKAGEAGECFFVVETTSPVPKEFLTSPMTCVSEPSVGKVDIETLELGPAIGATVEVANPENSVSEALLESPITSMEYPLSDSELDRKCDLIISSEDHDREALSDTEAETSAISSKSWSWGWGGLPQQGNEEKANGVNGARSFSPPLPAKPWAWWKRGVLSGSEEETKESPTKLDTRPSLSYYKSLRLSSDQLKSLNLQYGCNSLTFNTSKNASCSAKIYLWKSHEKIVISDVDGTITKSDVLGHLYTFVGRDWTHSGVAKLYTSIYQNGYKILYLTSRALGQADYTRLYLAGIEQESFQLPEGPVIMSPDRLFMAFHREVIQRRPEEFKIACLRDIRKLFPESVSPFYAGFGNRNTDAVSYKAVGMSASRIFTINSGGELRLEMLGTRFQSSYGDLDSLVDMIFPPLTLRHGQDDIYSDLNFWKLDFNSNTPAVLSPPRAEAPENEEEEDYPYFE